MRTVFAILAACLVLVSATHSGQQSDKLPTVRTASAADVAEAFETNDARADELFAGKVIEVTGDIADRINGRGPTEARQYDVIMSAPSYPPFLRLRFEFEAKDRKQLIELMPGRQIVTIRAYCVASQTETLEDERKVHFVRLKDCRIIAVQEKEQK